MPAERVLTPTENPREPATVIVRAVLAVAVLAGLLFAATVAVVLGLLSAVR